MMGFKDDFLTDTGACDDGVSEQWWDLKINYRPFILTGGFALANNDGI